MRHNVVLVIIATLGLIQLALAGDTCPYAFGDDGSFYDLSSISWGIHFQYDVNENGVTYAYNISICTANPAPCSGACASSYSSGVCQTWGNGPSNSRCLGSAVTRNVVGLDGGAGVQIIYSGGDVCGSCVPSGPRVSVITLVCDQQTPPGTIKWMRMSGGGAGQSPTIYFAGKIYCRTTGPVDL